MSEFAPLPFHPFDRESEWNVTFRRLPHWSQPGTICFLTWRTNDSMPKAVLHAWHEERRRWLARHGIDVDRADWRDSLARLDQTLAKRFLDDLWNRWHDALDAGHGGCPLREADAAAIVGQSLTHFDGQRYSLLDWVVMPNHVHLLAAFRDEEGMLAQCESWKHYTAVQLNRRLGRRGRFWQPDGFDHLVRSEEQFQYLRRYIADNPRRASLAAGTCLHYSKPLPP